MSKYNHYLFLSARGRWSNFILKPAPLVALIASSIVFKGVMQPSSALAQDYFNPSALEIGSPDQAPIDLDFFSSQGGQLPGIYPVDIYLNGNRIASRDVKFVYVKDKLQPDLTVEQLQEMGVKLEAFPILKQLPPTSVINTLSEYIPDASSTFQFNQQRLDISIPQAALTSEARGYVDPELWDQGLNAALFNYTFSGANTQYDGRSGVNSNYYLNLRSGLNIGAWRLHNYSAYNQSNGVTNWENVNTYLQRDVQKLKGQMTLGDSSTPSDVFTSVQYRGVQLASEDNMYPDSLKGFAPVIRGIAQSNAQVTVRQNGYIIYQTYVPAGAFTITDLYPTSSSGDMEVTITEADGSERRSVQPFSAVPVMLREGRLKYSVTAGQYRSQARERSTPTFAQSTLIYGLPYDTTLYGGLLTSPDYSAGSLGVGHGFGTWGSLSMDVTHAKTILRDGSGHAGQSLRFKYAKDIEATGTTFTLAGYRYSTSGYYDFQEANEIDPGNFNDWRGTYNKRSRAELNINQSLGDYGSFYINGYQQDFWKQSGYERSVTAGYNFSHNSVTYGVAYTYSQSPATYGHTGNDQQLAFNVQIPLEKILPSSRISYSLNSSKQGGTTQNAGLSGTALADNNLSYNIQTGYANRGVGSSGNTSASYKGTYGEAQAGYNYNPSSQQINYGFQGGVVVHPYGVTFSQQQGETMALIRAPGASDVKVESNTGVNTDWRGYAVVPYVSTYRKNRVALSTSTLADEVEIESPIKTVIPTKGALVLADFQVRRGSRVLMTLKKLGKPIPFGATATLIDATSSSPNTGMVGLEGEVFLSGMPESGRIQVEWGDSANQRCEASYVLPEAVSDSISKIVTLNSICK